MATNEQSASGRMSQLEAQLVSQAMQDSAFRDRLLTDPKAVLAEHGLTIPDGVKIEVVQETPSQYYLVLPAQPSDGEGTPLSDLQLEAVSGGLSWGDDQPIW